MTLNVSGKQMQVGESLTKHAEEVLNGIIKKYYGRNAEASVIVSKDALLYKTEISVHLPKGVVLNANDEDEEAYVSFDNAARKLSKQIRKYKEMIRSRKNKISEFTIKSTFEGQNKSEFYGDEEIAPVLIADVTESLEALTVVEAQDKLINSSDPICVFKNKNTNRINVIYWRRDGNIGWVDVG